MSKEIEGMNGKEFDIADNIIEQVYPDIYGKGKGWWGGKRIPNFGILRGAISKQVNSFLSRISTLEGELRKGPCCNVICHAEKLQTEEKAKKLEERNFNLFTEQGCYLPEIIELRKKVKELEIKLELK